MAVNDILLQIDPSRYVVYQMMLYAEKMGGAELIQKQTDNLLLFRTRPFVDSLYNYVYVLSEKFGEADMAASNEFFGGDFFRIKTTHRSDIGDILSTGVFKLKDIGYNMEVRNLDKMDFDCPLPDNIKIEIVGDRKSLEQVKHIFAEAFDYRLEDYDRKFGFLDAIMLNEDDRHIKSFLLYEDGCPVSTGAYYAFDKFSVENIGTLKAFRGRGYAGLIVRRLLREAKELGYREACLDASEAGSKVYEKIGFEFLSKSDTYIKK